MKIIEYKFIDSYSPYPGGRYIRLGVFSGEDFRDRVLIPIFENGDKINIDATGVKTSFSPSFLDESFGELAKRYGIEKFNDTVTLFSSDNNSLTDKMIYYVNKAVQNDKS